MVWLELMQAGGTRIAIGLRPGWRCSMMRLPLETAMTDDTPPPDSKLTRSKQRWASEHKFITGDDARHGA
ncbi:hypothetical protein ACVWYO_003226 [Sphingomonas sp. UYP23]